MPFDYDEMPVLPEESSNLQVHVAQCGKRYNALRSMLFDIRQKMERQQIVEWAYRGTIFPLVLYIAVKLGLPNIIP